MDADVLKARLLILQFLIVLLDQLETRIRHFLIVVPPLPHQAVGIIVDLGRVGDVVALSRIGLVLVGLLLDVSEVTLPDV